MHVFNNIMVCAQQVTLLRSGATEVRASMQLGRRDDRTPASPKTPGQISNLWL